MEMDLVWSCQNQVRNIEGVDVQKMWGGGGVGGGGLHMV